MFKWMQDIGCAAGIVPFHATRLTIEGDDPDDAAGSAAHDGEQDDDAGKTIVDEDLDGDDPDLDDQPRGRRTDKQDRAYDDLKSERDRLKAESERKDRLLHDLQAKRDQQEETRREVNDRTNATNERAEQRAREVAAQVKSLDRNDPNYVEKVYTHLMKTILKDQEQVAEEVSRRTSSEVIRDDRTREERKEEARRLTLDALEDAGLDESCFDLVQGLAVAKGQTDPGWFQRTSPEDQLPELVRAVKERIIKHTRSSREFKDDKRRHREGMDGVIETGSRGRRGSTRDDDDRDDQREGPGSMLADLARLKKTQKHSTSVMLRQNDR